MTGPQTNGLVLEGVRRSFKSGRDAIEVVKGVSFEVRPGEILCLLGPNGAGKTTTIKMAATLLEPTSGRVVVDGINAVRSPREARCRMGLVLGGDRGFYMRATALDNLRFFGQLQGLSRRQSVIRVGEVISAVGLGGRAGDRVETFSRGMRQRLHVARALLTEPSIVLLDEPSIGLDPEGALALRGIVERIRDSGTAVLLTTHYMHEAEALADRVAVMVDGTIAISGTQQDIAAAAGMATVTSFRCAQFHPAHESAIRAIVGVSEVFAVERNGAWSVDVVWSVPTPLLALLRDVAPEGSATFVERPATLEEAYLSYVNRVKSSPGEVS